MNAIQVNASQMNASQMNTSQMNAAQVNALQVNTPQMNVQQSSQMSAKLQCPAEREILRAFEVLELSVLIHSHVTITQLPVQVLKMAGYTFPEKLRVSGCTFIP